MGEENSRNVHGTEKTHGRNMRTGPNNHNEVVVNNTAQNLSLTSTDQPFRVSESREHEGDEKKAMLGLVDRRLVVMNSLSLEPMTRASAEYWFQFWGVRNSEDGASILRPN